ncbi:MAG: transcription termination factor NusA [Christensenellales bacterium]
MINKDFFLALDELEKEKKIDKNIMIEALEAGLASAYKKEYGECRGVSVKLNPEKNSIKVTAYVEVVDEVTDPDKQISMEELDDVCADKGVPNTYKVGDIVREDVTPKDFTRIAAQTAKQVVIQRLTEAKRNVVMGEMSEKEGEILSAVVRRIDGGNVYVEITQSQMEGVLMPSDQVRGEKYNVNDVIKVYLKRVRSTGKGAQVSVSRTATGFVKRLFEMEVPEIKSGLVYIKGIVREAGYRTKMAVATDDKNIDPVGACIGTKGVRVNAIVSELNGEKIDVIEWCAEPLEYIARALSPAKVLMVQMNDEEKSAKVIVPDDKLSLAIGKEGQNARLAAKLTGWKIDVKPYSTVSAADSAAISEENN